jgi:LSD1 subclass zinc finger protein
MSTEIKGVCPLCGVDLYYSEGAKSVKCNHCDAMVTPKANWEANGAMQNAAVAAVSAVGFDNPESALVYLDNYFEKYDWTEYCQSKEIQLSDIAEVVETTKIKSGASSAAWILDFKSLAVPVSNKLKGLEKIANELAEKCDVIDDPEFLRSFDTYCNITEALIEAKDEVLKQLALDVKYAKDRGASEADLANMSALLTSIKTNLDALKKVEDVFEIPAYAKAKKAYDEKKEAEFSARGINARSIYNEAMEIYNSDSTDKSRAVVLFEKIRGYADTVKKINELNKYFNYHREFFHFMEKEFIFKRETFSLSKEMADNAAADGSKKKGCALAGKKNKGNAPEASSDKPEDEVIALSLYEVVDGVPADKALIKGIEQIITCYGSKLYFFKNNRGVVAYDFHTQAEVVLDEGKKFDYATIGGKDYCYLNTEHNGFYFKKRLPAVFKKLGCVKSMFKKNKGPIHNDNNYSLQFIDMRDDSNTAAIPEMVDIAKVRKNINVGLSDAVFGNSIFYQLALPDETPKKKGCAKFLDKIKGLFSKKKAEPEEVKTCLMLCDLKTKENKRVLEEGCELNDVVGDKIVYTLSKPNWFNLDLHVYDTKTGEDTLVEDNVFDYFDTIQGNIYYTVGNYGYPLTLICNNLEGTNRIEVLPDVSNVLGYRAGWIYVQKGSGRNAVLEKVSADGKERIFVCSQYKSEVKFIGNYFYFISTANELRCVRTDGKDNRVLAENIDPNRIIVDRNDIFFTRYEQFNNYTYTNSLYKLDKYGKNIKKLVFDISKFENYSEKFLYYSKEEDCRFKVIVPNGKKNKNGENEHFEMHHLKKFFRYNKETAQSELVLTLGLPHGKTSYKGGCFLHKKDIEADIQYIEVPIVNKQRTRTDARMGAVSEQQTVQATAQAASAKVQGLIGKVKGIFTKKSK